MISNITESLREYIPLADRLEPMKLKNLKRVLIVEDDQSLTNIVKSILEDISPEIEIQWATSGEEAEHYLRTESDIFGDCPYDLVIADIFLEGETTGLDIWKLCDRKYPDTHIIVMSSLPAEKFVSHLNNEGACPPYLQKPFTMDECKETLSDFL